MSGLLPIKLGLAAAGQRFELKLSEGRLVLDPVPNLDELSRMATEWVARSAAEPLPNPSSYYRERRAEAQGPA